MDENISTSQNLTERETMLRDLAIRLSIFAGDPRVGNPHVLIGELPQHLPVEIPLPEGRRVVGTLIRGSQHATSVVDVDLPMEQVLKFYRERMQAAGWQELEFLRGRRPGGFTSPAMPDTMTTFCRGSRGPGLRVNAYARGNTSTDLRLDIDLPGQLCAQQARMGKMMGRGTAMHEMIPRLDPPPGGRQMPSGGGGGIDSFHMNASLELNAPIDLTKLAAHYAAQLERAGWTRDEVGQSGPIIWNTWSFRDEENEPCRGFFFILRMPGQKEQYMLYVQVNWGTDVEQSSGWFSYAPFTQLT
jgi:hypothetical protein